MKANPTSGQGVVPVQAGELAVRSVAQFFFEVGYGACFAEVMIRNDCKPPFALTDAHVEAAWPRSIEAHEDGAEMDRYLAAAAFAQPPASVVDRSSREALNKLSGEWDTSDFVIRVLSAKGHGSLPRDIAETELYTFGEGLLNALTNSGAPVPGDARPAQAWIDRASQIESAARALLEGVDDLFKRADAGGGRLYAANRSVLEDRCDQLALAVNTPKPILKAANPVPGDAGGALVAAELRRIGLAHFSAGLPGSNAAKDRATLEMAARQIELGVAGAREAFLDLIADAIKFDEQQDESAIYYTLEFTDASLVPLIKALGIEQKFGTMWVDDEAFSTLETPAEAIERTIELAHAAPAPSDGGKLQKTQIAPEPEAGVPAGMVLDANRVEKAKELLQQIAAPWRDAPKVHLCTWDVAGPSWQRKALAYQSKAKSALALLAKQATPTDEAAK